MDDPRAWQEQAYNAVKFIPRHAAALTTPIEPLEQKPLSIQSVLPEASAVATDSKILEVATEMLLHILHHGSTAVRPKDIQTHAEFLQLLTQPFALSLATYHKTTLKQSVNRAKSAPRNCQHNSERPL